MDSKLKYIFIGLLSILILIIISKFDIFSKNKELFFVIMIFLFFPTMLLTFNKKKIRKFLMGVAIFATSLAVMLDINFMNIPNYRMTITGYQITLVDLIALMLFFTILFKTNIKKKLIVPGIWIFIFYLLITFLSISSTSEQIVPLYGYFAIFQFAKAILIYWIFYQLIEDEDDYRLLVRSLMIIALFHGAVAFYQRYFLGKNRVAGYLVHPNVFATYMVLLIPILLLAYAGNILDNKLDKRILLLSFIGAVGSIIVTISRAGTGAMGLGIFLTVCYILFFYKPKLTNKQLVSAIILLLFLILIGVKAKDTIVERFESMGDYNRSMQEQEQIVGSRGYYDYYAKLMLNSNPLFGIGYNNFNHVGINSYGKDLPPAHSIYWLTLAELGYFGFMFFLLIFVYFIVKGTKFAFSKQNSIIVLIVAGLVIALLSILFSSYYDDNIRRTPLLYLIFIYFAYIAKARQLSKTKNKFKKD